MNLSDYIADPDRRAELASALKCSPDYLYQVATERRRGRAEFVADIVRATRGMVTVAEIWPDLSDALAYSTKPRKRV